MVNTFMPSRDFQASAFALDKVRLNKQLFEARQIMETHTRRIKGWPHHPATKMWIGYSEGLCYYARCMRDELRERGIKWQTHWGVILSMYPDAETALPKFPNWYYDELAIASIEVTHKGRLYEKDSDYYAGFRNSAEVCREYVCCSHCNYYWPTHVTRVFDP